MLQQKDTTEYSDRWIQPLLEWFQINARKLPWRETKDPYRIWVSEIMLQQTRVEAVKGYYTRFLDAFPDVRSLADAPEDQLMKLWQGLGYYNRARNMQIAARTIVTEYAGVFPSDLKELRALKGIGDYTAGAIASIAFSQATPAVDGNVLRVMSRIFADPQDIAEQTTKRFWHDILLELMPKKAPAQFNQALMELGAIVCLPNGAPLCQSCPVRAYCKAYAKNQMDLYPVKSSKKPRKQEHLYVFFLLDDKQRIALRKREKKGLLAGLWELPCCGKEISPAAFLAELGVWQADLTPMPLHKHIFTHIEWQMEPYFVCTKQDDHNDTLQWLSLQEAEENYALPSAFRNIWQDGIEEGRKRGYVFYR